jgi:hypothetical protein
MLTQENFESKVNHIPTLFTQRHALLVYGLIGWLRPMNCIEIGSYAGYMSAWMARALQKNQDNGRLYCVDDFSLQTNAAGLHNNLTVLELPNVIIIEEKSENLIWPYVDFAFIDGDHSLDGCAKDVYNAEKAGAKCIVIHDTSSWWGPRDFVDKMGFNPAEWGRIEVGFDQGLTVYLKHSKSPLMYSQEDYPTGKVN